MSGARDGIDDPGFLYDFGTAVLAWKVAPLLAIATVGLYILELVTSRRVPVVFLPLLAVLAGWPGVQRVWYARAFNGDSLGIAELPSLLWELFGRFARLALIVSIPLVSIILGAGVLSANYHAENLFWACLVVSGIILSVTLTFIVPALVFTTDRVRDACRVGLRMVGESWPGCAMYVIVPPLVTGMQIAPIWFPGGRVWGFWTRVGGILVLLAFKGAILRFYLRRMHLSDEDGSPESKDDATPEPPRAATL